MKFKKAMLVTLLLLAILTIGAVNASEDVNVTAAEIDGGDLDIEVPANDEILTSENTQSVAGDGNFTGSIVIYDGDVYDNKNNGETRVADYNVPAGAEGNVLITVEDEDWSLDVPISDLDYDNGVYYLVPDSFAPLDYGTYNITLAYTEDGKTLMSNSATLTFKSENELDEKYNVTMTLYPPENIYYGREATFNVDVLAKEEGCPYSPYGHVKLYLNGKKIGTDDAPYTYFDVDFDEFGEYNFKAEFQGDDYFNPFEITFDVNLTNSMYRITTDDEISFQRSLFNVYSPVLEPSNIVITINGKKYNVFYDDDMDEYYCNASGLNYGVNTINIYYPGDDEFGEYSSDANITVTSQIDWEGSYIWGDPIEFSLTLPKGATGTLKVYSVDYDSGDEVFTEIGSGELKDGEAIAVVTGLPVGETEVYANFTGSLEVDGRFIYINIRPRIEIPKAIIAGEDAYITVKVSNDSNGRIVVNYQDSDVEHDDYDYVLLASADVVNGEAKIPLSGLKQGHYDLECIFYYDKDEYYHDTHWDDIYVVDKYDINLNISYLREDILVNEEYAYVEFDLPAYAEGNVTAYVDGKKVKTESISEYYHYLNFNATGLSLGEHTILLNFTSETQGTSSASGKFNIVPALIRIPDNLTINDREHGSANAISVVVNEDSKGTLTILIDNKAYLTKAIDAKADEEVQYFFALADVARGKHDVAVTYIDDRFGSITKNNTVNFGYKISLNADEIYGEDNLIYVGIPSDLGNGDLTISVDGKKIEYVRNSSQFTVNPSKLSIGNHTVVAKYSGDDFYPADEFKLTIEVLPEITGLYGDMLVGSDEGVSLILPGDAKGKLNVTVKMEYEDEFDWGYKVIDSKLISFENGKAYYSFANLEEGYYRVETAYTGDDYEIDSRTFYFDVSGVDFGEYYIGMGENKTITFISRFTDPGQVRVILSRIVDDRKEWDDPVNVYETFNITIVDCKATHTFNKLPVGRYHIFIAEEFIGGGLKGYQGGDYFYVEPTHIEASSSQYDMGSIDPIVLDMPADANGTATVEIYANYSKSKPDLYDSFNITVNGASSIDLNSIIKDAGTYGVVIKYNGNYGKFETSGSSFKVNGVAKADPNLSATVNPIKEGETAIVNISINENVTGHVTVNNEVVLITKGKGTAKLTNLPLGTHEFTVLFAGDSKFTAANVTVKVTVTTTPKIDAKDAKVQYTAGKYYSVTVYGADGKVAAGTEVIFTLNNKQVAKTTTDANGVAKFKVTQTPVTNAKIVVKALGVTETKKLTITHAATLSTVTVKKSAKKITLKVTVKVNGKAVKNKVVKFKFNNKLVKTKKALKTNSKGVATVVVPTNYYKNLKVGKTVTYQVTYLKDTVKKSTKVKA